MLRFAIIPPGNHLGFMLFGGIMGGSNYFLYGFLIIGLFKLFEEKEPFLVDYGLQELKEKNTNIVCGSETMDIDFIGIGLCFHVTNTEKEELLLPRSLHSIMLELQYHRL